MNKKEKIELSKKGRGYVIWGLILLIGLWWTIIGAIIGIVFLIYGFNCRMKSKE